MRRGWLLLTAALGLAWTSAQAAAPPIELHIPDCPAAPLSLDAFLASLKVELAGRTPPCCVVTNDGSGAGSSLAMRVTLAIEPCDPGTNEVTIRILDPMQGATTERRIALRDIPADARPRALALAVAEQVRSAAEGAPPTPAPVVVSPSPAPPAIRPGATLMGEARTFPGHDLTLWGLRAGGSLTRGNWQSALELEALAGDPAVPFGSVSTRLLGLDLSIGPRFRLAGIDLDVGGGGMLGWAWMSGDTSAAGATGGSGSALIAALGAHVAAEAPVGARFQARALLEAGGMTRSLTATVNDSDAAGIRGFYLSFALGLAIIPTP